MEHQLNSLSQSLWSQGGAARVLYKTISLKSKCYLLICVKIFLTKSNFPKFCKERGFVPLWLETSQHIATNHGHCHGSSLSFFLIFCVIIFSVLCFKWCRLVCSTYQKNLTQMARLLLPNLSRAAMSAMATQIVPKLQQHRYGIHGP